MNIGSFHVPFTKQDEIKTPSQTSPEMDRLTRHLVSDAKLKEKLAQSDPYIRVIYTPQVHFLDKEGQEVQPDKDGHFSEQVYAFDDIEKRMSYGNYVVTHFVAPYVRSGSITDKSQEFSAIKKLKAWRLLNIMFKSDVARVKSDLNRRLHGNIAEMALKWASFCDYAETNFLPGFDFVWDIGFRGDDVTPAWTMYYQEAPNQFNRYPVEQPASIDLMGSAQRQRQARKDAESAQAGSTS